MKVVRLFCLFALALSLTACCSTSGTSSLAGDVGSGRAAIERSNVSWAAAVNGGDMNALASHYAEDALLFPPNSLVVRGRPAIKQFFEGMGTMSPSGVRLMADEIEVHGDTAIEVGRYELTLNPAGAAPMKDEGKYIVIWKKQSDGSWKMSRDIFNSDQAMH